MSATNELRAEVERLRKQLHDQQDTEEHNFVRNAREYKRVCDENAKLREQLAEWKRVAESKQNIIDHMRDANAENAKLRELVQKMMRFMEDGDWCTTCEVAKECDAQEQYEEDCLMRGVFHDRMRELGVEVDE